MFVTKDTVLSTNSDLLLADYKHSQITIVKCFITLGPGTLFSKLYFLCNLRMWAFNYTRTERPVCEKHTSLLDPFVSNEENKRLWIRPQGPSLLHRGIIYRSRKVYNTDHRKYCIIVSFSIFKWIEIKVIISNFVKKHFNGRLGDCPPPLCLKSPVNVEKFT